MADPTNAATDDRSLVFVVEKLRLAGYTGFWVVVLVGVLLTTHYAKYDLHDTLLTRVFGYNNVCVYFDYPPANYVLPFLWAVTLVLLLAYVSAHWLHMRAEFQQRRISPKLYRCLSSAKLFEAFTLLSFSTIFAVSPQGWDRTLYIHTAAFFLLQLGLVSLAVSNTLHGILSGYWQRLDLPGWFAKAAIAYCAVFAAIVCFKIPTAINAMSDGLWWTQTEPFTKVARGVDILFLVCSAIVPMMKAAYLSYFKADELEAVRLTTSIVIESEMVATGIDRP